MPVTLFRVRNEQVGAIVRSLLIDKADDGLPNRENYAQFRKQRVYVPYRNPVDPNVKGYSDFVPTDRILLSADRGTIKGLVNAGYAALTMFSSALIATPTVTGSVLPGASTTLAGTTFLSVTPDLTYVILTNLSGVSQTIPQSAFTVHTAISIAFLDASVTIGTPAIGWTARVQANSRLSNSFTLV
jgi:hypothetical protein